jgi:hypothetical protein
MAGDVGNNNSPDDGNRGVDGAGSNGVGKAGVGGVQERGDNCRSLSSHPPLNRSTSQQHFAAFCMHFAGGGEAGGESTVGGGGGTGAAASGGAGGVGSGADCLGVLEVDKPADSSTLEPDKAALR